MYQPTHRLRPSLAILIVLQILISLGISQEPVRGPQGQHGGQKPAQGSPQRGGQQGGSGLGNYEAPPPVNNVPTEPFNILLGRPTSSSVTVSVMASADGQGFIEYRPDGEANWTATTPTLLKGDQPQSIVLDGLRKDTRYVYHWNWHPGTGGSEIRTPEYSFQTQRARGESFTFTVQADSHLDENTSAEMYLRTLANAGIDQPDFHFELGDTFMTGKYVRPELALGQYRAQRYFLGHLCHSAPLFFALGNHDGESGGKGSITWATQTRKSVFPNPDPNEFYSGNEENEPGIGYPENYYAWEWGDAQFLVLDPFRYTVGRRRGSGGQGGSGAKGGQMEGDNWHWTLGPQQYQWLAETLEKSNARYRFVFLHHLVGGASLNNRGGAEVASLWEWGGHNVNGVDEFAQRRPGWELPIHDLLEKHGVSIVFHGHDHLFAKQDYDGIVYQEVPQPGHARSGNTRTAVEYGYLSGEIQPSSGHVRVRVDKNAVRVDYVRAYLQGDRFNSGMNGEVTYSYQVLPHDPK